MYTADLVAQLTVPTHAKPINSLQDLVDNEDITIQVPIGTSIWTFLEDATNEIYESIKARKVGVNSIEEAVEIVKTDNAVLIAGERWLSVNAAISCGKTRAADEKFFTSSYAFVLPKGSPYKAALNDKIFRLVESGIVENWESEWLNPSTNCSN